MHTLGPVASGAPPTPLTAPTAAIAWTGRPWMPRRGKRRRPGVTAWRLTGSSRRWSWRATVTAGVCCLGFRAASLASDAVLPPVQSNRYTCGAERGACACNVRSNLRGWQNSSKHDKQHMHTQARACMLGVHPDRGHDNTRWLGCVRDVLAVCVCMARTALQSGRSATLARHKSRGPVSKERAHASIRSQTGNPTAAISFASIVVHERTARRSRRAAGGASIPNYIAPLFFKMAQNLDLRCVLVPAPWMLGPKHVSNPE